MNFQYRDCGIAGKCRFIAESRDKYYEEIIDLPFPFDHDFWYEQQHSNSVITKSKAIAKKYKMPEWIWTQE